MITVAVCILAVFFTAASVTPLLLSEDVQSVVDLSTPVSEEQ